MTLKLCTPAISATLSNLSTAIFVSNCVPGATVVIRSLPRPGFALVKKQIGAPDGLLALEPGVVLMAGDRLVASQSDGSGHVSPETHAELAVVVGQAPTNAQEITPVDVTGRMWECGRYALVAGAVPGSVVEIVRSAAVIGSGMAHDGVARVALASALQAREQIRVRQRVGAIAGPLLPREVEPLPLGGEEALPAPLILGPVRGCQTSVRIEGVFEGAQVKLARKSGEVETSPFDLSGLWFNLATPLAETNGWVKARQDMPACRRQGQDASAGVGPPVKPPTPYVYPLCAGVVSVFIDNLERGAEVRIGVGADEYVTTASSAGYNRFDVDPLPPGSITVQTFLCGMGSDIVTAMVETAPAQIDTPVIVGDLVKCQRSVPVAQLKLGAIVQLWAKGPSIPERPISVQHVVYTTTMDLGVTTLIEGAEVWAVQWACALERRDSPAVLVRPAPAINDPDFTGPVTRIDKSVTVKGTVRDAEVELRRRTTDEHWDVIGKATAKGPVTTVAFTAALAVDQRLQVRQRYCGVQSPGRTQTTVVKPVPLQPVILGPPNGQAVPVDSTVNLAWKDAASGPDADRKADTFEIKVVRDGDVVLNISQSGTTVTLPQVATTPFSAQFQWTVVPRNSTGAGQAAHANFVTPKAPDPMITANQDKDKLKVTGNGFASVHPIEIEVEVEYSALAGSPNSPVEVNDNRRGKATLTSNATGAIDSSVVLADVLEPRVVITGTGQGTQMIKAPPYPGAIVRVTGKNAPPIPASKGSANKSNKVTLTWSA